MAAARLAGGRDDLAARVGQLQADAAAVLLTGLAAFLAGSAACGAAPSTDWLIAFRAAQGAGAGCLMASMFALTGELFEPRERAKYQGYSALVGVPLKLPRPEGRPRIDHPGIVLLGAAVTCFTLLTSWAGTRYAWTSPVIGGLAAGTVVLAVVWVLAERRAAEPVIPLRLFRDRSFSVACAVAMVGGATGFGPAMYLPMFFQRVGGAGATDSGLLLLPMTLGLLASSMGAGRYIARTGRHHRLPAASMAVSLLGVLLLATMDAGTGRLTAGLYTAVLGFGAGLSQQVVMLIAQNAAPRRDLGAASSGVFTARMIGTAAGMAVFGGLLASRFAEEAARKAPAEAMAAAFHAVFLSAVPPLVAGLAAALLLRHVPLATSPRGGSGG
ncbi:MFS transporter [Spirillospora sp. NPDC127200]